MLDTPSSPSRSLSDAADAARLIPEAHGPGAHGAPPLPEAYGVPRLVLMVKNPRALFAYWELPESRPGEELWLTVHETDSRGTVRGEPTGRYRVGAVGRYHLAVPEGGRYYRAYLHGSGAGPLLESNVVFTPPGRPSELEDAAWLSKGELSRWFHWQPGGPWSPGFDLAAVERWLSVQRTSSDGRFEVEVWTR